MYVLYPMKTIPITVNFTVKSQFNRIINLIDNRHIRPVSVVVAHRFISCSIYFSFQGILSIPSEFPDYGHITF